MSLDKITADGILAGSINAASLAVNSVPSSRLTTTGVVANSYGNATHIATFTTDAAGRLSVANTVALITSNSTVAGVIQVVDSVTNTSILDAAAANSVKTAFDLATTANSGLATAYSNATTFATTIAGTAYTNAVAQATTLAGTAYSNAVSVAAADATSKAATAYSNAVTQATTLAGTAYSNAVTQATSLAATAYSNAVSTAAADATSKAATAYSNAVSTIQAGTTFTGAVIMQANLTANNVRLNGSMQIDGNLTVSGTSVTLNVASLSVGDNMIYLNSNSTVSNPDLGFAGNYNDGTYRHAGLFRDATDARWKFFHEYLPEPDASAYIDTSNASFALANLQAHTFIGAGSFSTVNTSGTTASGNTTITGFANVTTSLQVGTLITTTNIVGPNNAGGAANTLIIQGGVGTGSSGDTGGHGALAILGGSAANPWTSFTVDFSNTLRRGGIVLQAGTANTTGAVYGSTIEILGANASGSGSTSTIYLGGARYVAANGKFAQSSVLQLGGADQYGGGSPSLLGGSTSQASMLPNASGGTVEVGGGDAQNGRGGDLYLFSGATTGTGNPGDVYITGGTAYVAANGGSIYLNPGAGASNYGRVIANNFFTVVSGNREVDIDHYSIAFQGAGGSKYIYTTNNSSLIYQSNAHAFYDESGVFERMRIVANGNIGIGTSTPGSRLVVNGTASVGNTTVNGSVTMNGVVTVNGSNSNRPTIVDAGSVTMKGETGGWSIGTFFNNASNAGVGGFGALGATDSLTYLWAGPSHSSPHMVWTALGRVGVGTETPSYKFEISANNSGLRINTTTATTGAPSIDLIDGAVDTIFTSSNSQSAGFIGTYSGHGFGIRSNNATRVFVTANGNTAVKDTVAPYALDVAGDIGIRGANFLYMGHTDIGTNWGTRIRSSGGDLQVNMYSFRFNDGGYTNAIEWMAGTANGNVGMGTTSPNYKLDIRKTSPDALGVFRALDVTAVGAAGTYLDFGALNGSTPVAGARLTGVLNNPATSGYLTLSVLNASSMEEKVRILSSGNVGIGNTAPTEVLHVQGNVRIGTGTSGGALHMRSDTNYAGIGFNRNTTDGGIYYSTTNAFQMQLSSGNFEFQRYNGSGTFQGYPIFINGTSGNIGFNTIYPQKVFDCYSGGGGIVASFGTALSVGGWTGFHFGYSETPYNNDNYKKSAIAFQRTDNHGQGGNASGKIHFLLNNGGTGSANLNHSIVVFDTDSVATTGSARVGIGTTSPIAKLEVGARTFSGNNGMYADSRVGIGNHGSLTGMMLASTYNSDTYPEYGLVFVHGANTSSYNVWSLSPDGPAKGSGLNFIYGANVDNIHVVTPKVVFSGNGNVGIGTTTPGTTLDVNGIIRSSTSLQTGGTTDQAITLNKSSGTAWNYIGFATGGTRRFYFGLNANSEPELGTDNGATVRILYGATVGGSLGVGLTNPSYPLQILNNNSSAKVYVSGNTVTTAGGVGGHIIVRDQTATSGVAGRAGIHFSSSPGTDYTVGKYWDGSTSKFVIIDGSGSSEFITILGGNGNVGIGTTNPLNKLDVRGSIGIGTSSNSTNNSLTISSGNYSADNHTHNFTAPAQSTNDDVNWYLNRSGGAYGSFNILFNGATRFCLTGGSLNNSGHAYVMPVSGKFGIGNTAPTEALHVQGNAYVSGTITEASSITLKTNIEPITNALSVITQLKGVIYDRLDGTSDNEPGLIAEDTVLVSKSLVACDDQGNPVGVKYTKIVAYLIEAVKELQNRVDQLVK